jgi:small subunit ribosomal protein S3Ae
MANPIKKIETKAKKKRWCTLIAPKTFLEQEIGETLFELPKSIIGKKVTVNLMALTGDPKKQGFNVTFEITEVKENSAMTECIAFEMTPASVKRMVRRGRERLDDSFVAMTNDGKLVRIKPFMLTRFNTSKSVTTAIRKLVQREVQKYVNSNTFDSVVKDLVANRLQSKVRELLKKIYPTNVFEIRRLYLLSKAEAAKARKNVKLTVEAAQPVQEQEAQQVKNASEEPVEEVTDA